MNFISLILTIFSSFHNPVLAMDPPRRTLPSQAQSAPKQIALTLEEVDLHFQIAEELLEFMTERLKYYQTLSEFFQHRYSKNLPRKEKRVRAIEDGLPLEQLQLSSIEELKAMDYIIQIVLEEYDQVIVTNTENVQKLKKALDQEDLRMLVFFMRELVKDEFKEADGTATLRDKLKIGYRTFHPKTLRRSLKVSTKSPFGMRSTDILSDIDTIKIALSPLFPKALDRLEELTVSLEIWSPQPSENFSKTTKVNSIREALRRYGPILPEQMTSPSAPPKQPKKPAASNVGSLFVKDLQEGQRINLKSEYRNLEIPSSETIPLPTSAAPAAVPAAPPSTPKIYMRKGDQIIFERLTDTAYQQSVSPEEYLNLIRILVLYNGHIFQECRKVQSGSQVTFSFVLTDGRRLNYSVHLPHPDPTVIPPPYRSRYFGLFEVLGLDRSVIEIRSEASLP